MNSPAWDAVVFDYGKVLSCGPSSEDLQQFTAITGVPDSAIFFQLYADTRAEYDSGRADYRQHWQIFCEAAQVNLDVAQVDRLVAVETSMWMRLNTDMLALARDIKARGLQIAILSNMPPDLLEELRRGFDWLDEFNVQIWSCELGVVKPATAMYRACLEALNCEPARALFFDDRLRNVEAAAALGIDARLFESAARARAIVYSGLGLAQSCSQAR